MVSISPLTIYCDGSCRDNRNVTAETPAGWGVVIVCGDTGLGRGRGEVFAELLGTVETNSKSDLWFGAEVGSNNTGELSALAHALRWLLQEGGAEAVRIRSDSEYALNIAKGLWKPKANRELARRVQNLWSEVKVNRELRGDHIHAHRGHRWNERADHLAWRAVNAEEPLPLQFWKPGKR